MLRPVARFVLLAGVALALQAQSPPPATQPVIAPAPLPAMTATPVPDADQILIRAKAIFRAHPRPPYEVYTVDRRDETDGAPIFADTYTLRIWYRRRDRAAMARRVDYGHAVGPLFFIEPMFNAAVDPGPPSGDIFEPAPERTPVPTRNARPTPRPLATELRTLVTVQVTGELDYRAEFGGMDGGLLHLRLQPRRDPDRNRLRDLWLEPDSLEVRRFRATDRVYYVGTDIWRPLGLTAYLAPENGLPLIRRIDTTTDVGDSTTRGYSTEGRYRFFDISFPASLPDWYFDPRHYGDHVREAPAY
jgi:hypothetical protein